MGRPHRVRPTLRSAEKATPGARVLFITDPDDEAEIRTIDANAGERIAVKGNYAKKINVAVNYTDEPLLLFAADDLEFHPGWFEAATALLSETIGVVATEDQCNGRVKLGELATHPLVTRAYCARGTIDDPGKVLHEGYVHEYVDREFSETARARKAFAYAPDAIVEHLHPQVGKAPMDDLYRGQLRRMRQGAKLYTRRIRMTRRWTRSPSS